MKLQSWIRLSAVCIPVFCASVVLALSVVAGPVQTGHPMLQQVEGTVTVDERPAAKGAEISSGAVVHTAKGSSAVVSLGKLGRVEVFEETTMTLTFTDSTVTVSMLEAGRVRMSSSSGVVTTNDGTIKTIGTPRAMFTVDTSCGNTFVAVSNGKVELRAGSTVKQIAAGGQDTAGTARPGCTP
ncbi:MAG TPA: hypothetical protein VE969_07340, partial [Pyrinomonadaceae bacterium]|nr:hypothetical protein [Pyrinomonadaceae bacterium]